MTVFPRYMPLGVIAFLSLILFGCGGARRAVKDYEFHAGKGKVVTKGGSQFKGGGSVFFSPANDPNYAAEGTIEPDGSFSLTTNMETPRKTTQGVPVGEYEVRILTGEALKGGPQIIIPKVTVKREDTEIIVKMK